ncbi:MAG: hypothetical protein ABSD63_02965 [Candidatus Korobacteraceae bacterium]|jgi:hypothetical protein
MTAFPRASTSARRVLNHYEFLASYTWSHSIDDSIDLEATVAPRNNYDANADRSTSLFEFMRGTQGVFKKGDDGESLVTLPWIIHHRQTC